MKMFFAVAASIVSFFVASSAHALTIDASTLDTMRESKAPLNVLDWKGVSLKVTTASNGRKTGTLETPDNVSADSNNYFALESPEKTVLSRIFENKAGDVMLERAEISVTPDNPVLQVTSISSVHLREVARIDAHVERAKTIPVYAYKSDAKHVVILVGADGSNFGKRDDGSCKQNGQECTVESGDWHDHMVGISIGPDRTLAQARGGVTFADAPKGETNAARTYIVNASYTQTTRDPEPVIAITTRTMEPVFQNDGDEE